MTSPTTYVPMTDLEKAVRHLLLFWWQYGTLNEHAGHPEKENVFLDHLCMMIGQDAAKFLEELGYGDEVGRGFVPNKRGYLLMLADPDQGLPVQDADWPTS